MKKVMCYSFLLVFLFLMGCGSKDNNEKKSGLKVGLVLNLGGLGDKSFNDSAFEGMKRAEIDFDIDFKYVEPNSLADFNTYLVEFAEANYDLVIALGHDMKDPVQAVASDYPNINFAIVDSSVELANVKSILFNEQEGSFLAGYLASLFTKTNKIGFIGAMDIPSINNFYLGYKKGAEYGNPNINVVNSYVAGARPFNDPARAKEIAISMYNNNVDVLYSAAGGSGRGMLEAIKEIDNLYGIGVDSNQDAEIPGKILSSMLKRIDNALYQVISDLVEGKFTSEIKIYGIREKGVGLTDFSEIKKANIDNIEFIIEKTNEVHEKILNNNL